MHVLVMTSTIALQHVVWEKLDDLTGNTQFLKGDFTPYGSSTLQEQVSDAADLVQAAFAGVGTNKPSEGNALLAYCFTNASCLIAHSQHH